MGDTIIMTETDRELLMFAAKAAGIECGIIHGAIRIRCDAGWTPWNPRYDYGEALLLAKKLGLCLDMRGDEAWVGQYPIEQGNNGVVDADVRRAIVLVAAEIGRNMK